MRIEQTRVFRDYSATFDAQVVHTWEAMISAWNSDPESHPDPYEEPESGKTFDSSRLQVAFCSHGCCLDRYIGRRCREA